MKKYTAIILFLLLLISFTACSAMNMDNEDDSRYNNSVHIDEYKETYCPATEPSNNEDNPEQVTVGYINNTEDIKDFETAEKPVSGEGESEKGTADSDSTELTGENPLPDGISSITREEAGLTTIPNLDFDDFTLNPSIQRLIENPESYSYEDYKNGLVYDEFLIISERFGDNTGY